MDRDENHMDTMICDYTVRVKIIKEVTVSGYPYQNVDDLMDDIVDEVANTLDADDVVDAEIMDVVRMD